MNLLNYDGLYNKEFWGERLKPVNHFYDKKLHFQIIENGTILPHKTVSGKWMWGFGGIVDAKNNYIQSSFVNNNAGGAYTIKEEEVNYVPENVVYLGMFFHVWGHCMTDNIKRVWFLQSKAYKRYFKDYPLVWVPTFGGG